jgi:two-component system, cell cycle response regulator
MKILLIDEDLESVTNVKARLQCEDLEIISATTGKSGLDRARIERPDLILLDVNIPGMSGFEVCGALKDDADLSLIPVIFLTGAANRANKVKGLDIGAVDFVTKPFDAFELRARVRAALRSKRLQDMLIRFARIDPLTELWNRRELMDRLRQEWTRCERYGTTFACIMVDVDHFKGVNDTHGHAAGDQALQKVARVLAAETRESDITARYGGEEFVIIMPNQDALEAVHLAERCRKGIESIDHRVKGKPVSVTASFGVSDSDDMVSAESVLHAADAALYRAKRSGRNRVEQAPGAPSGA